jgi:hypothetical protein
MTDTPKLEWYLHGEPGRSPQRRRTPYVVVHGSVTQEDLVRAELPDGFELHWERRVVGREFTWVVAITRPTLDIVEHVQKGEAGKDEPRFIVDAAALFEEATKAASLGFLEHLGECRFRTTAKGRTAAGAAKKPILDIVAYIKLHEQDRAPGTRTTRRESAGVLSMLPSAAEAASLGFLEVIPGREQHYRTTDQGLAILKYRTPVKPKRPDELVVGDRVLIQSPVDQGTVREVVKVTKTQVVLSDGARFRRKDGLPVGCGDSFRLTARIEHYRGPA